MYCSLSDFDVDWYGFEAPEHAHGSARSSKELAARRVTAVAMYECAQNLTGVIPLLLNRDTDEKTRPVQAVRLA